MSDLSSKALLVSLSIRQWNARKYDRKESEDVARRHNTTIDVARVNKMLLPYSDLLADVQKKANATRTEYYKRTLPWSQKGVDIIRSEAYLDFTQWFRDSRSDYFTAVDRFCNAYPQLYAQAPAILNGMFDANDYPTEYAIRDKFDISMSCSPIPNEGDWRVKLGDDEMDELRTSITEQVASAQAAAMKDLVVRFHNTIKHAHEKLANPDAIFRDSMVDNAKELVKLLPSLNLTDDPDLNKIAKELEGSLCAHNIPTLRSALDVRHATSRKMRELMGKMSALYGTPACGEV